MGTKCNDCNNNISQTDDNIECYGFCGKSFHLNCLSKANKNYKKSVLNYLSLIPNFQWYCNECIPHTINGAFKGILKDLNQSADVIKRLIGPCSNAQQRLATQSDEHRSAVALTTVKTPSSHQQQQQHVPSQPADEQTQQQQQKRIQISELDNNIFIDDSMISIDTNDSNENSAQSSIHKRKLSPIKNDNKRIKTNSSTERLNSYIGNFVIDNNSHGNSAINSDSMKYRSIYVSKFIPSTESIDIMKHLNSHSFIHSFADKIVCKKLVPNWSKKLSFVSFKITVPEEYFDIVCDQSIWHSSIKVKEFETLTKSRKLPPSETKRSTQNRRMDKSKNGPRPYHMKPKRFIRNRPQIPVQNSHHTNLNVPPMGYF